MKLVLLEMKSSKLREVVVTEDVEQGANCNASILTGFGGLMGKGCLQMYAPQRPTIF